MQTLYLGNTAGAQIRCWSKRKRRLKQKKIIHIGNFITTHVDQHDFMVGDVTTPFYHPLESLGHGLY